MDMDLAVRLTVIMVKSIGFGVYLLRLKRGEINPAASTWIILTLATVSSLASYYVAENFNWRAGILNTIDVGFNAAVLVTVLFWNHSRVRFEPREKWYLGGVVFAVALWATTGYAVGSNMVIQLVLVAAYVPTLDKVIQYQGRSESYSVWGAGAIGGLLALYPALLVQGNMLAALYTLRSTISCIIVIGLITFFRLRPKVRAGLRP